MEPDRPDLPASPGLRRLAAALAAGDPPPPLPRSAKPRGSLADAAKAARECVPCQQAKKAKGDAG